MDVGAVMDELGTALGTIAGLRVFPYWAGKLTPPAAVVEFPESLTFDETYGRGSDRIELSVMVIVGHVNARASRDLLAQYADGTGLTSVKAAIEGRPSTSYDSARVMRAQFGTAAISGTDYLAATFYVDIIGTGA